MRFRRIIVSMSAVILLISFLAGCAGFNGKDAMVKHNSKGEYIITDKPLELTIFLHYLNTRVFNDDWPIFKEAAWLTNITLKGTASKSIFSSAQAYTTMAASNPLPDIIHGSRDNLLKLGMQGGLIDLEELVKEYAPNIKKFMESSKIVRNAASALDGKMYFVPGSHDGLEIEGLPSNAFFIRKDWLDKLGLEMPKTVEEFHDVLKAFKTRDPNGNGIQDEVPYFDRNSTVDSLLQLFDANQTWYVDDDGIIKYGPMDNNYRLAMIELAKWYKEGLIDSEIYTRGKEAREMLLGQDLGGCTHGGFSSVAKFNDTYKDSIKGFEFVTMAPPADINGVVKEDEGRLPIYEYSWGISKDNKHPIETIKYMDFWMSEKGRILHEYGVEGVHYTIVDGKPQFTDLVLNNELSVPLYMVSQGGILDIGTIGSIDSELCGMNEIAKQGYYLYANNKYVTPAKPLLTFTADELKFNNIKFTNIQTFLQEQKQKWIFNTEGVNDKWDNYIETLKSMKIDEVMANYNAAYQRYLEVK